LRKNETSSDFPQPQPSSSLSLSSLFPATATPPLQKLQKKYKNRISVTYHDDKDGSSKTVRVPLGTNLLEAAHANHVDLEGACECSLACSTCHVIIEDPALFSKLPEPTDDENDMLDLAFGLTETSRLGCQVIASKDIDGISVRIPGATRNFAVDGHVPKPH
jgi:ferredoxin